MKKGSIVAAIIVVIVLIGGGYVLVHRPTAPASTSSSGSSHAPAVNNAVLMTKTSASLGQYLAEPNGQPLYIYNGDSSGASNCTGACLANWPAYQATGSTANLPAGVGTIKRTDNGQIQYTYNGMPLYTFTGDSHGQVTGDGVENFSVAKPAASSSANADTNTSTTTPPSQSSATDSSNNGYPY